MQKLDLEQMLVRRLEGNQLRLPPYPAVAMKLQNLAEEGRCSTRELCTTIAADAALVAAVLRRANTAAYSAAIQVASLEAAINRIGVDQLLKLALAQSVGKIANSAGPLSTLRRDVWRRSLLAARMGTELAETRGIDVDQAFVAGLLHDFGAITVLIGLEDLRVELPVLPAATWKIFVDKLQPRFGGVFAQRWHLPEPIAHAIEYCFDPDRYAGPHKALVGLMSTVTKVIAILERAPGTGIAALIEVKCLSRDERYRLGALIPQIAELMETFEAPFAQAEVSVVQHPASEPGWPVDFVVTCKREMYTACSISPNSITFRGAVPLQPNWLSQLVLQWGAREIDMLANVKSCEAHDGGFMIVAQPFGLDGPDKQAWMDLLAHARP